jgi:hypothetical protein
MVLSHKSLFAAAQLLSLAVLMPLSASPLGTAAEPVDAPLAVLFPRTSAEPAANGSEHPLQVGAPAVMAPGMLRFALSAVAPESPDPRVAPMGVLFTPGRYHRTISLPPLGAADRGELSRLHQAAAAALTKGRLLLGLGRDLAEQTAVSPQRAAPQNWTVLNDGRRLWTAELSSAEALGLRVHLEGISLPAGAKLLVYYPGQPSPATPITAATLNGEQEAWTETVLGEKVVIECQLPPEVDPAQVAFRVTGVSHLFQLPGATPNTPCENDVTCYPAWATAASGVAMIEFVESGNTYACSGCLLNTVPTTYTPYFLTASHCIVSQPVASTLELWWFYQSSTCNGPPPSLNQVPHTSGGADFLASFGAADSTFLRLRQSPPAGAQFLGWSVNLPPNGAAITAIHHPGGGPKRISFGHIATAETFYWDVYWTSGVTEQGSSGSPLLNSSQQVIGQLYGGTSSCANPGGNDQYGRFDGTFPYVAQWLQPSTSKVIGVSGPLGFGSLPATQRGARTLVIANNGTGPITVSGISYPAGFSGSWSGTIPASGSQPVTVTFAPTGQYAYGGTITVNSDASSGPHTAQVSGTGYFPLTRAWNLWWQDSAGLIGVWRMSGPNMSSGMLLQPGDPGPGWSVKGIADFNYDGQVDLLFENASGAVAVWLMNGFNQQRAAYLSTSFVDPQWQIAATGDINHDGKKDILWQYADGSIAVWLMDGLVVGEALRFTPGAVDPSWHLVGTADFNGDSQTDLLWQNDDGRLAVWFMSGATQVQSVYLTPSQVDPSWKIVGVCDFNGDGHPGLIWQQDSGALAYWQMTGTVQVHSGRLNPGFADPSWTIVGPK